MQDRPTASELLEAIGHLLEGPLLASTQGTLQHQVRVAANLCRILLREIEAGPVQDAREVELLRELLGDDSRQRDSASLSAELAARLRSGTERDLELRAWPTLIEIVRGKLAVAKPGYDAYDFSAESDGIE
jgi:hypothetical protein